MRWDLEKEMETFEFPSQDKMIEELQAKNLGYDFQKGKHSITSRTPLNKLKQYYIADKLSSNLGDISKVNKLPYADVVTYSFPCFVPGTMVLTDNGYKKIEDIQEGDMVLTHTNQYQKVIKPMKNYCDSYVYKINAMCSDPVYTTEEHPFYVRKRYRIWNNNRRVYERKFNEPEWVKAKDLNKDYYVGIAINQKSEIPKWDGMIFHWSDNRGDRYSNKLGQYMDKEAFWWIIGRYLGDGWLSASHGVRPSTGIIICCAKNETSEITTVLDRLEIHYTISSDRVTNRIQISMRELYEFCLQFGRGAANKHLTSTILNLPINLLKSFLDGYISADGCFTQGKYKVTSVSRELIYGIGQCVAKVYKTPFSVYKIKRASTCVIEDRTVNQKDSYDLTFKLEKSKQDHAFYEDGYIWCPIKDISIEEYNGYVYNMEVENDNSYVVQNIIVHNCTDLSVAGKGEGMVNKCDACGHSWPIDFSNAEEALICPMCGATVSSSTRSGLLGQVQRLLSVAKDDNVLPKYLLLENVKNLVGKKFKSQFDAWIKWLDSIGYNTYWKVLNAKNFGIPQNRERYFAISIRKDIDTNGFTFPEPIPLTICLKDILEHNVDEKYYLPDKRIEKILNSSFMQEKKRIQTTNVCDTLLARDWKDPKCVPVEENEIKIVGIYMPSNHDASRVVDVDGIAPTVKENHGTVTAIAEPQITIEPNTCLIQPKDRDYKKKNQSREVHIESKNDGISHALRTNGETMVIEPFIVASRGRNPENPSDRTTSAPTEQRLEPNFSGTTNCLTSVQKDNYVCEPQVLRAERTEYGKAIRKQYEAGEVDEKIGNMRELKPRTDGISNTITTLLKDNYVVEPIDEKVAIVEDQFPGSRDARIYKEYSPTLRQNCGGLQVAKGEEEPEPQLEFVGGIGDKDWAKDGKQLSRNYPQGSRVYSSDGIASTLTAQGVGGAGGFSGLYTVEDESPKIKWRVRKLTEKECWRLMGFTDQDHDRAAKYTSASARYKQAGNSIVTSCLVAIFYSLFFNDSSDNYTQYLIHFDA